MKKYILCIAIVAFTLTSVAAQKTKVVIETDSGRIVLMLYDGTPKHRDNMIKLATAHFYDSTLRQPGQTISICKCTSAKVQ